MYGSYRVVALADNTLRGQKRRLEVKEMENKSMMSMMMTVLLLSVCSVAVVADEVGGIEMNDEAIVAVGHTLPVRGRTMAGNQWRQRTKLLRAIHDDGLLNPEDTTQGELEIVPFPRQAKPPVGLAVVAVVALATLSQLSPLAGLFGLAIGQTVFVMHQGHSSTEPTHSKRVAVKFVMADVYYNLREYRDARYDADPNEPYDDPKTALLIVVGEGSGGQEQSIPRAGQAKEIWEDYTWTTDDGKEVRSSRQIPREDQILYTEDEVWNQKMDRAGMRYLQDTYTTATEDNYNAQFAFPVNATGFRAASAKVSQLLTDALDNGSGGAVFATLVVGEYTPDTIHNGRDWDEDSKTDVVKDSGRWNIHLHVSDDEADYEKTYVEAWDTTIPPNQRDTTVREYADRLAQNTDGILTPAKVLDITERRSVCGEGQVIARPPIQVEESLSCPSDEGGDDIVRGHTESATWTQNAITLNERGHSTRTHRGNPAKIACRVVLGSERPHIEIDTEGMGAISFPLDESDIEAIVLGVIAHRMNEESLSCPADEGGDSIVLSRVRLTSAQAESLGFMKTQIIDYDHGYSYIETCNQGWKPHKARVINALRTKGLIECFDSGNGEGKHLRSIPESGAFTTQITPLGWFQLGIEDYPGSDVKVCNHSIIQSSNDTRWSFDTHTPRVEDGVLTMEVCGFVTCPECGEGLSGEFGRILRIPFAPVNVATVVKTTSEKYYEECPSCNAVMEKMPCCGTPICPQQDAIVCDCDADDTLSCPADEGGDEIVRATIPTLFDLQIAEAHQQGIIDDSQYEDTLALVKRANHEGVRSFVESLAVWGFNRHDHTLLWEAMVAVIEASERDEFEFFPVGEPCVDECDICSCPADEDGDEIVKRHSMTVQDALDSGSHPTYNPAGKLLSWIRTVFRDTPGKYVVRTKQRDPHNWGNKENLLYDDEVIVANTKDELIQKLLDGYAHMSQNICYLTYPNRIDKHDPFGKPIIGKLVYTTASQAVLDKGVLAEWVVENQARIDEYHSCPSDEGGDEIVSSRLDECYEVTMAQTISWTVKVVAKDEDEAREIALDNCPSASDADWGGELVVDSVEEAIDHAPWLSEQQPTSERIHISPNGDWWVGLPAVSIEYTGERMVEIEEDTDSGRQDLYQSLYHPDGIDDEIVKGESALGGAKHSNDMSEGEEVFGCDVSMIDEAIERWLSRTHRGSTKDMAFSMLSDVQELVSMGASRETIRKKLNRVKYVLDYERRKAIVQGWVESGVKNTCPSDEDGDEIVQATLNSFDTTGGSSACGSVILGQYVPSTNYDGFSHSAEQAEILNACQAGFDVDEPYRLSISSVAGSGKTTLVECIARLWLNMDKGGKVIATAFNVSVAGALKKVGTQLKAKGLAGFQSMGYSNTASAGGRELVFNMIRQKGNEPVVDDGNKYRNLSRIELSKTPNLKRRLEGLTSGHEDIKNPIAGWMAASRGIERGVNAAMAAGIPVLRWDSSDPVTALRDTTMGGVEALMSGPHGQHDDIVFAKELLGEMDFAHAVLAVLDDGLRAINPSRDDGTGEWVDWSRRATAESVVPDSITGYYSNRSLVEVKHLLARRNGAEIYDALGMRFPIRDEVAPTEGTFKQILSHFTLGSLAEATNRGGVSGDNRVLAEWVDDGSLCLRSASYDASEYPMGQATELARHLKMEFPFVPRDGQIRLRNLIRTASGNQLAPVPENQYRYVIPIEKAQLVLDVLMDVLGTGPRGVEIAEGRLDSSTPGDSGGDGITIPVSMSDFVYASVAFDLKAAQPASLLIVDEVQDFSQLQGRFLQCFADENTSMIAVGDIRQSLYLFNFANAQATAQLVQDMGMAEMPMTICWRNSKEVAANVHKSMEKYQTVALAAGFDEEILKEAGIGDYSAHKTPSGEWREGEPSVLLPAHLLPYAAEHGDLVCCRVNAPLAKLALRTLIDGGKSITLPGGKGSIAKTVMKLVNGAQNPRGAHKGFGLVEYDKGQPQYGAVSQDLVEERHGLYIQSQLDAAERRCGGDRKAAKNEQRFSELSDMADAAREILHGYIEQTDVHRGYEASLSGFEKWLESLCGETEGRDGHEDTIRFASVHRTKGAQGPTAFVVIDKLKDDEVVSTFMLPHCMNTPAEVVQELNAAYVAFTRGINRLVYITHDKDYADKYPTWDDFLPMWDWNTFDWDADTCEGCGGQKTPEWPGYGPDGPENGNCEGELDECDTNKEVNAPWA